MTKDEALKLALEALENMSAALREDDVLGSDIELMLNAAAVIRVALAQPERDPWREAVAQPDEVVRQGRRMSKQGLTEVFREFSAQPEERNFCPKCGKRTADLTTIHTQGNT